MKDLLITLYKKYILGYRQCPRCGNWCECTGTDITHPERDEYYCKICREYFFN